MDLHLQDMTDPSSLPGFQAACIEREKRLGAIRGEYSVVKTTFTKYTLASRRISIQSKCLD
jgi:hypothetical protein